ncbi:MAG TPA: hypothetical protein VN516_06175 [Candidatus Baltobacteraceae bacterium]|nr:hypothetical protein [Candidatus Baltobacteraceae bacterium]
MQLRTQQLLEQLKTFPFFSKVGQPIDGDYIQVKNWKQAVELCVDDVWSSVQLQAKNEMAQQITLKNYERSIEWNAIAAELRPQIVALAESVANKFNLNKNFKNSFSWDLIMLCRETEFSDLMEPYFFVPRLLPIYMAGHFPCGWTGPYVDEGLEGDLPHHKLVVF